MGTHNLIVIQFWQIFRRFKGISLKKEKKGEKCLKVEKKYKVLLKLFF
jgi:hypothetical protein